MIDDDFQNIFRKMIEQFFGTEFGSQMGTEEFSFKMQPMNEINNNLQTDKMREIEKIELEDEVLLLVDNVSGTTEPSVAVKGKEVTIEFVDETDANLTTTIEFEADPETSFMHLTNGVLEIALKKLKNANTPLDSTWNVKIQ